MGDGWGGFVIDYLYVLITFLGNTGRMLSNCCILYPANPVPIGVNRNSNSGCCLAYSTNCIIYFCITLNDNTLRYWSLVGIA